MQPIAGTTRIQKATSLRWVIFLAVQVTDLAVRAFVSSRMQVSVSWITPASSWNLEKSCADWEKGTMKKYGKTWAERQEVYG